MKFRLIESEPYNKLNLDKDVLYDLYITQQMTSNEVAKALGCSTKTVRNYLQRYGIPIRPMADAVKLERSKWSQEKELERSQHYHNTWVKKPPEEKAMAVAKRMASPNINSEEAILKAHETRAKNGTSMVSKSEDEFYHKLLINGFQPDDIVRGYIKDPRYPFNCDFYIKSKDVFIEYQGHQSHGDEPFDSTNPKHLELLQKLQSNKYDMRTWTERDPRKLQTALKNKITLILIYPKHKTYLVKDGKMTTIDINDINKI